MSDTTIPGVAAKHATITDNCRIGRGMDKAFDEAVRRLWEEYKALCEGWPIGKGAQFHIVLTVEKPPKTNP